MIVSKNDDKQKKFEIDDLNFIQIHHVDKSFDIDVKGEVIQGRGTGQKKDIKLGKVLRSKYNTGIALVDLTKLDKVGSNAEYILDDYRLILW